MKHILISSVVLMAVASTGHAALLHLDKTTYNFNLMDTQPGVFTYEQQDYIGGSLFLTRDDAYARPIGVTLNDDGTLGDDWGVVSIYGAMTVNPVTHRYDGGFYGAGNYNFSSGIVLLRYTKTDTVSPNYTSQNFRIFTGVRRDPLVPFSPDPLRDDYVDIRINFAPVPEPASLAVLGFGALAMLRKRKKS
jgi:hypothetical protein